MIVRKLVLALALAWVGTASAEVEKEAFDKVVSFLRDQVINKRFEVKNSSEPKINPETKKKYQADFERVAEYKNLRFFARSLTYDYSVKVHWKFYTISEDGTKAEQPYLEDTFDSILSFELASLPGQEQLYGFARFSKSLKNGVDREQYARAYRISAAVLKDGDLGLIAKSLFPMISTEQGDPANTLIYNDFSEQFTPGSEETNSKLKRTQVFRNYLVDPKTLDRSSEINGKPEAIVDFSVN